ncbi:MAG: hypothetical protein DDT33_01274 [Firmicutes bacterium]|nr:hypothetical protein [Bacillota bacterium]
MVHLPEERLKELLQETTGGRTSEEALCFILNHYIEEKISECEAGDKGLCRKIWDEL